MSKRKELLLGNKLTIQKNPNKLFFKSIFRSQHKHNFSNSFVLFLIFLGLPLLLRRMILPNNSQLSLINVNLFNQLNIYITEFLVPPCWSTCFPPEFVRFPRINNTIFQNSSSIFSTRIRSFPNRSLFEPIRFHQTLLRYSSIIFSGDFQKNTMSFKIDDLLQAIDHERKKSKSQEGIFSNNSLRNHNNLS